MFDNDILDFGECHDPPSDCHHVIFWPNHPNLNLPLCFLFVLYQLLKIDQKSEMFIVIL